MGAALGSEPVERRAAMADVDVNIDEPGSDVEPGSVHHLARLTGGNVFFDRGDLVFDTATSITASTWFAGSITWPPFNSKS